MCVCMCVYVCMCMYTCVYVCGRVCVCMCMYVHTCVCMYACMYVCTCITYLFLMSNVLLCNQFLFYLLHNTQHYLQCMSINGRYQSLVNVNAALGNKYVCSWLNATSLNLSILHCKNCVVRTVAAQ